MVTRLDTAQPSNHNTDADFPHGAPRSNITPNDKTGTIWRADWVKDIEALKQGMLIAAGTVITGVPDTAVASQWLTAIKNLTMPDMWIAATTGAVDLSALFPWARGARFYFIGGGGGAKSGAAVNGGGGGGSGGIRVYDLLVSEGFDWTFNVQYLGTGGPIGTAGSEAGILLASGHQWQAPGGSGTSTVNGAAGHCGGGGAGGSTTAGGAGGKWGGQASSTGTGTGSTGTGGASAASSVENLVRYGMPVSPQRSGVGGTGISGNGGGGGGGHLTDDLIAEDGAAGDSGVNSGGKGGRGFGGGGGGGGGTSGAFLGVGGIGGQGLVGVVPF